MKLITLVSTLMLLTPTALTWASAKPGETAPAFTLKDRDGKEHSLAQYKGKTVVLEWLNHECPYVKKHYNSGNMQKLQNEAKAKGAVWLSVISSAKGKQGQDPSARIAELAKEGKAPAPTAVLVDDEGKVGKAFGAKVTPHMFVIDPSGKVAYNGAIDDKPTTELEDVAKAKNYIEPAIQAAIAGKAVAVASTKPYGCGVKY